MNSLKTLCAIMCITAAGCHKPLEPTVVPEPVDTTQVVSYDSYSALKVGNYWVYQEYTTYLHNDSSIAGTLYDSIYVEKDTMIDGNKYFKYCTQTLYPPYDIYAYWLRDSLHYIVNSAGVIAFSSEDFTTVFLDRPFGPNGATLDTVNVKRKMTDKNTTFTVPAGTFTASSFSTIYYYPPGSPKSDIYRHEWYAKNVGKVKYTWAFYFSQPDIFYERWLVRYHMQ